MVNPLHYAKGLTGGVSAGGLWLVNWQPIGDYVAVGISNIMSHTWFGPFPLDVQTTVARGVIFCVITLLVGGATSAVPNKPKPLTNGDPANGH